MLTRLAAARSNITNSLRQLHGTEKVRQIKDAVAWIETRAAWIGLRWTYVSYVSGCQEDFIRLRNDVVMNIPKSFWRFSLPSIRTFELTVLFSEITDDFVSDFSDFVSFLADGRDEIYTWEIFGNASYPNYGWSVKANELRNQK
jgi:hypothetical protein